MSKQVMDRIEYLVLLVAEFAARCRVSEAMAYRYLNTRVFANCQSSVIAPNEQDVNGFEEYMMLYKSALKAEITAYENI